MKRNSNAVIILILAILIFAVATYMLLSKITLNTPYTKVEKISSTYTPETTSNPSCEKVEFEGLCRMAITVWQYDQVNSTCSVINGGGCSAKNGFDSEIKCLSTCVKDWEPKTAYDFTIYSKGLKVGESYKTFDIDGYLELSDTEKFRLIESHNLDKDGIKVIAIVEKLAEIPTMYGDGKATDYQGSYILPMMLDPEGYLVSNVEPVNLGGDGIRARNIEIDMPTARTIEITYESGACGTQNLPDCGERITNSYQITNGTLTRIPN